MAIYVDRLINWGKQIGRAGPLWCHMTADSPDELHRFAQRIGLRREWCSDKTQPGARPMHYDLTTGKRRQALAAGAEDITGREHEIYVRLSAEERARQDPLDINALRQHTRPQPEQATLL